MSATTWEATLNGDTWQLMGWRTSRTDDTAQRVGLCEGEIRETMENVKPMVAIHKPAVCSNVLAWLVSVTRLPREEETVCLDCGVP